MSNHNQEHTLGGQSSSNWEVYFGLALSVFAAILAVNDLGGGKYGDDELQLGNEKTKSYMWYQSKSIKESLAKGQLDLLNTLINNEAIRDTKVENIKSLSQKVSSEIQRYKMEKEEILKGSTVVGEANWTQEVNGSLGQVIGALQLEASQEKLSKAGDKFDMGSLFLQISLVLGAIGLIVKKNSLRCYFLAGLVGLGIVGTVFCILGYRLASATSL